jgi:hypothetical protein
LCQKPAERRDGKIFQAPPENIGCAGRESKYVEFVDWQKIVSLGIVGSTVALFLWFRFKPRKFSLQKDTHCGCSAAGQAAPKSSIVFRARRGEKPEIIVKMR